MITQPLVIMRSNDYSYLGIIRSCYRENIPVYGVVYTWESAPHWLSDYTRCETERFTIENPYTKEEQALEALCEIGEALLKKHKKKLMLIPSSDTNLMFIQNNFSLLCKYFLTIGSKNFNQSRLDIIDKGSCSELLTLNNIETPKTFPCKKNSDIEYISHKVKYPCIYKPAIKDYAQSFYKQHSAKKAIECENSALLIKRLKQEQEVNHNDNLIVQEKVIFDSALDEIPIYLYVDKQHEITLFSAGIKRNIEPFPFGTAIDLELHSHPTLYETSQRIAKALKWRGMLMIEFIYDQEKCSWTVIEINTRPWLMSDFYSRCGLNYMKHLAYDLAGVPIEKTINDTKNKRHIDLQSLFKQNKFKIDKVRKYLDDIEGEISFTYIDKIDPTPGIKQLEEIAKETQKSYTEIESLVKLYAADY